VLAGKVYDRQMTVLTNKNRQGALWEVVAAHGHTVFYTEIPVKVEKDATTTPKNSVSDKAVQETLDQLNKK
jgi:hypothetical protein